MSELNNPKYIRMILETVERRPMKRWGQNFMVSPHAVDLVVRTAGLKPPDVAIEIGPGLGVLTARLLTECRGVIAVEMDPRMVQLLTGHIHPELLPKLTLLEGDFLKFDLAKMYEEAKKMLGPRGHVRVISNLPYSITTPALAKVLESELPFESMTLTIQKEVAERLVAKPGGKTIGSISNLVQYYTHAEIAGKVSAAAFYPKPKVDSSVVHFEFYSEPPVELKNKKLFFTVVRTAYGQRRKMLRGTLKMLHFPAEALQKAFEQSGVSPERRPETLSLKEFAALANALEESK